MEGSRAKVSLMLSTFHEGPRKSSLDQVILGTYWSQLPTQLSKTAVVTSTADYCNTLYVGLPLKMAWKLQLVQNAAAYVIAGARWLNSVRPLLRLLHWLLLCFQTEFKVLVFTFKALYGSGPGYLRDYLRPYNPIRHLRSLVGGPC